jgi:hypothetical protein
MRHLIILIVCALWPGLSRAAVCPCDPGYYCWIRDGLEHCRLCPAGCACSGNWSECVGCSGGWFSPLAGASACARCPFGTTSDALLNAGCDPDNYNTPCENQFGPLGKTACRALPPPSEITFVAPNGAAPEQNLLVPLQPSY